MKTVLRNIDSRIVFIPIIRTIEEENVFDIIRMFTIYEQTKVIHIEEFNKNQVETLIYKCFNRLENENLNGITADGFNLSKGNLKELEQYILFMRFRKEIYWKSLYDNAILSNIHNLSNIRKDILILTSLFPTGIKLSFVQEIIRRMFYTNDQMEFHQHLKFLEKYNLILLNGIDQNLLKPSHEKITNTVRKIFDEEDFLRLRKNCIEVFKELAEKSENQSDFIYLVNNLIGIQKFYEIKKDIKYIIRLVDNLQTNSLFNQLFFYMIRLPLMTAIILI